MDDSTRGDETALEMQRGRKTAIHRAAAVTVSVAVLAGAMVASALPAGAASPRQSPRETYTSTRPTSTPCPIVCYGNVNHR